jgi:flagellar hook-associated protein 1 FlgK
MNGGTATLNQFYLGKIGDLGLALKGAGDQAKGHRLVADSLAAQAESVGGVSLDEEAANLVKSQRAYQAAARVMTAIDEMIDKIINGMGVVGR